MNDRPDGPRPLDHSSPRDDEVASLLRRAGRRPAVPADDAAVVKAAAFDQWRRAVRGHRLRRLATVGGGGLLAAASLLWLLSPGFQIGEPKTARTVATVEALAGAPPAAAGVELPAGTEIAAGTVLDTAADGAGRALLRLAGGATVRLDRDSRLRLASASELALERGAVYVDAGGDGPALTVRTPHGVVRDVGTQFEVRLADPGAGAPLTVRVRQGQVELERGADRQRATAGVELALALDGTVERRALPTHGPPWDWVLSVLPAFDAEAGSLHDLLLWAARQGGWRLRYGDSALAAEARAVRLHGSVAGLGLQDAIALSLLGSGLGADYRLVDGVLVVERSD